MTSGLATAVLFHPPLAQTSSPSRRTSRAGGSPPRFAVGGEGLRLRNHRAALPGEAPTLPLAKRGGRVKSSGHLITLPPHFASGRVAAALRGRRGGLAVAVMRGALPGEAPTLPLAKRGGRVKSSGPPADQNPLDLSGRQPQSCSSPRLDVGSVPRRLPGWGDRSEAMVLNRSSGAVSRVLCPVAAGATGGNHLSVHGGCPPPPLRPTRQPGVRHGPRRVDLRGNQRLAVWSSSGWG